MHNDMKKRKISVHGSWARVYLPNNSIMLSILPFKSGISNSVAVIIEITVVAFLLF